MLLSRPWLSAEWLEWNKRGTIQWITKLYYSVIFLLSRYGGGGGRILPTISYIDMCLPKGYAEIWSENGYRFLPFWREKQDIFKGQVWNWVRKIAYFGLKTGKGLKKRATHHHKCRGVAPGGVYNSRFCIGMDLKHCCCTTTSNKWIHTLPVLFYTQFILPSTLWFVKRWPCTPSSPDHPYICQKSHFVFFHKYINIGCVKSTIHLENKHRGVQMNFYQNENEITIDALALNFHWSPGLIS